MPYTDDTDDFFTYNARNVTVEFIGCGGEFCPGPCPDDQTPAQWWDGCEPFLCAACTRGTRNTALMLLPLDQADEYETLHPTR